MEQNKDKEIEVVSYEKEKIQLLLNILNNLTFVGVQQARGLAQISVILENPIENKGDKSSE